MPHDEQTSEATAVAVAGDPVFAIIDKFRREGIAAVTADDSAEIKGFLREFGFAHPVSARLARVFPCETAEAILEAEASA